MKKSMIGVLLALCLLLCSCSSGGPYTVTFDANGCEDPAPLTLEKSGKIAQPENIARDGYVLQGWYSDAAMTTPWDFEKDKVVTIEVVINNKHNYICKNKQNGTD